MGISLPLIVRALIVFVVTIVASIIWQNYVEKWLAGRKSKREKQPNVKGIL